MENTFPNLRPVHAIRAWSREEADETPLCGADKWHPDVWGYRTAHPAHVTCGACLERLEQQQQQQPKER